LIAVFTLSGIKAHMRFYWRGTAVSINQRSTIGKTKLKTGRVIPTITKTPKYRKFCEDLDISFTGQWAELYQHHTIKSRVVLFVKFGRGNHKGHHLDVDAIIKPMQDALEHSQAILNDDLVLAPIFAPIEPLLTPEDELEVIVLELGREWNFSAKMITEPQTE
jgi:Holliday junction resolvase RusA-like endonuclease